VGSGTPNPLEWVPRKERAARCIACHRPIVYGERCPSCEKRLRQRRKRKPR
jgi:hypothetical protein